MEIRTLYGDSEFDEIIRYASKGKEGVANRSHPLEGIERPKETKFCPWVAIMRNIITSWSNFSSGDVFLPMLASGFSQLIRYSSTTCHGNDFSCSELSPELRGRQHKEASRR